MNIKGKIRGIVFGSLYPDKIHINVGYGIGFMEGGVLKMFERDEVPPNCRMPNTYVWILTEGFGYENIKIVKMSDSDIMDNVFI